MTVSEITVNNVANYLKLNAEDYSPTELQIYLDAAIAYVKAYTGLDITGLDEHEDITVAVLVLCCDMHENRSMYAEQNNLNHVVEKILSMHSATPVS
jgi:Phage QLRG family, putative DNA packaging.